jgi:serine/threonine protein kinase
MNSRKYAVKLILVALLDRVQFFREIAFLAELNHPRILRILGWSFPSESTDAEIRTEYADNGSLRSVFKRVQRESKFDFWNGTGKEIIICGLVLAMKFVHSYEIVPRDLKPSNILISDHGQADFGTSRYEWDDEAKFVAWKSRSNNFRNTRSIGKWIPEEMDRRFDRICD